MTTLEIHIPDDFDKALELLNRPKEETVLSAVKTCLQLQEEVQLSSLLKEGYLAGHKENEMLAQEFKFLDISNWDDY